MSFGLRSPFSGTGSSIPEPVFELTGEYLDRRCKIPKFWRGLRGPWPRLALLENVGLQLHSLRQRSA